jgi:hypothetical protein
MDLWCLLDRKMWRWCMQEWGAEECATRASVMAREELTWAFHGWGHTSGSARFTDPATKSIRYERYPLSIWAAFYCNDL